MELFEEIRRGYATTVQISAARLSARSRNQAIASSSSRMVILVFPFGTRITGPRLAFEKS